MSPHLVRVLKEVYGYKNARYMVEGHKVWQAGINPYFTEPEFLKTAQEEGVSHILVDLRSPEKAQREHIQGAVNYPMDSIADLHEDLPSKHKKDARIIYYSDNEEDALAAHRTLRANGWENGYILSGGIEGWKAKGYPVASNQLRAEISFKKTTLPGAMSIPEYEKTVLDRPQDTIIVDVRAPGEYMKSMVPGALTIPIDTLDKRWSEIPKGKKVILQCAAGNRALMGYRILKNNGYNDVHWVDGKIKKFKKGILVENAYFDSKKTKFGAKGKNANKEPCC